jgi:hypothetical protein
MISAGVMLSLIVDRYAVTNDQTLRDRAASVFQGIQRCATVHEVPGFLARGVCPEDAKSIYPNSSRDQYTHAVHGLWLYLHSPLCDAATKQAIGEILCGDRRSDDAERHARKRLRLAAGRRHARYAGHQSNVERQRPRGGTAADDLRRGVGCDGQAGIFRSVSQVSDAGGPAIVRRRRMAAHLRPAADADLVGTAQVAGTRFSVAGTDEPDHGDGVAALRGSSDPCGSSCPEPRPDHDLQQLADRRGAQFQGPVSPQSGTTSARAAKPR